MFKTLRKLFIPSITDDQVKEIQEGNKKDLDRSARLTKKYERQIRSGDALLSANIAIGGNRNAGH